MFFLQQQNNSASNFQPAPHRLETEQLYKFQYLSWKTLELDEF